MVAVLLFCQGTSCPVTCASLQTSRTSFTAVWSISLTRWALSPTLAQLWVPAVTPGRAGTPGLGRGLWATGPSCQRPPWGTVLSLVFLAAQVDSINALLKGPVMSRAFEETKHFPMEHSLQGEGTARGAGHTPGLQGVSELIHSQWILAREPHPAHACFSVWAKNDYFIFEELQKKGNEQQGRKCVGEPGPSRAQHGYSPRLPVALGRSPTSWPACR